MKNNKFTKSLSIIIAIISIVTLFTNITNPIIAAEDYTLTYKDNVSESVQYNTSVLASSQYSGSPFITLNNNIPRFFIFETKNVEAFENYSELDELGRCGVVYACLGKETMPTEDRESISSVKPSGWKNKPYDFVDGGWLYNRCHLIGFQLSGEQANPKNLITGTRYFNVSGMLPFENMVADYIHETNNHVLYRVTPIYTGTNLVCEGVTIEALSLEDSGEGICFYVFCYNVQPDIKIDYATGDNWSLKEETTEEITMTYILNIRTHKFHYETCSGVTSMSENNKQVYTGTRQQLIDDGYVACGICKP
jgi:DNA-entry nuclease